MHLFSTGISGITGTRRTRTDGCAHVRLGIFLVQSSRTSTGELKPALPTDVTSLVASDRFARRQVVGHIEVMPQRRERLVRPILQFRIVATFGIALEQRHRVFMAALLIAVITRAEVGTFE